MVTSSCVASSLASVVQDFLLVEDSGNISNAFHSCNIGFFSSTINKCSIIFTSECGQNISISDFVMLYSLFAMFTY